MINRFGAELEAIAAKLAEKEYHKAISLSEGTRKRFNHVYTRFATGYRLDFFQASAIAKLEAGRVIVPNQEHIDELTKAAGLYEDCLGLNPNFSAAHMGLGLTYRALAMASANFYAESRDSTKLIGRLTESAISCLHIAKTLNPGYAEMADRRLEELIACRPKLRVV